MSKNPAAEVITQPATPKDVVVITCVRTPEGLREGLEKLLAEFPDGQQVIEAFRKG